MNTKQLPTMVDENGGKAVAVRTGPSNTFLVPTNMSEAMRLAELMAGSLLIPRDFQKKPSDCLMVIMQAVRWQMDPFAIIQKCSVIQGKLMYEGQLVAAVVNVRGNLKQRLLFTHFGEGKERGVTVSGQFHGEDKPREVDVELAKVKTSAKIWDTQPDQQLCYHGARKWARLHMPELMLGVYSPEEWDDVKADAERDIANGSSIHHPDDYSDGTPERLTKEPEKPVFSRAELAAARWEEKASMWKDQMDRCGTVADLDKWGNANAISIGSAPTIIKMEIRSYYKTSLENLHAYELANQVVHDSDDMEPRPATANDFDVDRDEWRRNDDERAPSGVSPPATGGTLDAPHQPAAARVPISQRAIGARETDGIPEYLDRRK